MKIVVDVVNSEKVAALTKEIELQKTKIRDWNAEMAAGTITQARFDALSHGAAAKIALTSKELDGLSTASKRSGMALGQLAYAIDDIQYGFAAIVNNIPQIAMGLGAGAGLAGAIGIAAVAINQLAKHWQEFNTTFGNTAPVEAAKGAIVMLEEAWNNAAKGLKEHNEKVTVVQALVEPLQYFLGPYVKGWQQATEAAERHEKVLEKIAEAQKKIEGIKGEEASKRGAEFKKALERSGGGEAVLREMVDAAAKAGGVKDPEMRKKLQENAELILGQGLAGENVRQAMPEKMRENLDQENMKERQKEIDKTADQMNKAQVEAIHEKEKADKDDAAERHGWLEDIKRNRIQSLEDEREKINKDQRAFDEKMWERMHQDRTPGQILQGSRAATDYYQGASRGADDPKQLAKEARDQRNKTNKLLEDIDSQLKKERRLVVPH